MEEGSGFRGALEWFIAFIGAANCLAVAILFSLNQSSPPGSTFPDLWPIPGLYFLELASVAMAMLVTVSSQSIQETPYRRISPWIASGITLAFVILGAWSIGLFLIPAFFAFLTLGVLGDAHSRQPTTPGFLVFLLVAVFLLSLAVFGAWSIGSPLMISVLLALLGLLVLADAFLVQYQALKHLGYFLIGGFTQALLIYLLLLPHL